MILLALVIIFEHYLIEIALIELSIVALIWCVMIMVIHIYREIAIAIAFCFGILVMR